MPDNTIKPVLPDGVALAFNLFEGTDALNDLYIFDMDVLGEEGFVAASDLLGQIAGISIPLNDGFKYLNGLISRVQRLGQVGRYYRHRLTLRPWLWILSKRKNMRIFQNQTAPEIIKAVFADHDCADFEDQLTRTYPQREYCTQYRETDLDFVLRLMEEEGIYFYFKFGEAQHTLVLCDAPTAHQTVSADYAAVRYVSMGASNQVGDEFVNVIESDFKVTSGAVATRDYTFLKPNELITGQAEDAANHSLAGYESYDWPADAATPADAQALMARAMDAEKARRRTYYFSTTARGLATGYTFTLENAPEQLPDTEFLITGATYQIERPSLEGKPSGEIRTRIRLRGIAANIDFVPPIVRTKPRTYGPELAVVAGDTVNGHNLDQYGRTHVHFFWDRAGSLTSPNSCWLRVSTPWASGSYGFIANPRVGDEVIVSFLHGDPDRPIITGRVYNANNMPPYPLPAQAAVTALKSRTLNSNTPSDCNELRFNDAAGKEEVWLQAQKDFQTYVKNDALTLIDKDAHLHVKGVSKTLVDQDRHQHVVKNDQIKVDQERHETIGGDHFTKGAKNHHVNYGQNINVKTGVNYGLKAGSAIGLKAGTNFGLQAGAGISAKAGAAAVIEGGSGVTLKAGGSFITVTPAGIFIKGPIVQINTGGAALPPTPVPPAAPAAPKPPVDPKDAKDPLSPTASKQAVAGKTEAARDVTGQGQSSKYVEAAEAGDLPVVQSPAEVPDGPDQMPAAALQGASADGRPFIDPAKTHD